MTRALYYPPADSTSQIFSRSHPGVTMSGVDRLVVHTTEGSTWPDYSGGAVAPTWTAMPVLSGGVWSLRWRQHFPANMSARALVNAPGGVETNTANCAQVELVGTCVVGGPGVHWPTADGQLLQALGVFVAWLHGEWGLQLQAPAVWLPYPASYGATPSRMTAARWTAFRGICGHQHVPENDHGDPGALDAVALLAAANQGGTVPVDLTPAAVHQVANQVLAGRPDGGPYEIHDPDNPKKLLVLTDTVTQALDRLSALQADSAAITSRIGAIETALAALVARP